MPSLESWMSHLPDNVAMNTIVLPATHDSGMSFEVMGAEQYINPLQYFASGTMGAIAGIDDIVSADRSHRVFHDNFTTQIYNVYNQLCRGARQFDLRITRHNGTYRAYHGAFAQTLVGARRYDEKWSWICLGIAQFMRDNPTEFLILKLDKQKNFTTGMLTMLNDELTKLYVDPQITGELKSYYIDREPISKLRGRVLVCGKPHALKDWKRIPNLHTSISFCEWKKDTSGANPDKPDMILGGGTDPVYKLLGCSEGNLSAGENILQKQLTMAGLFPTNPVRLAGMRGIWFNTYSLLRDIKTYSDQIWAAPLGGRDALWLLGANQQNVASIDFLNTAKANYVIQKNQHPGFAGTQFDGP